MQTNSHVNGRNHSWRVLDVFVVLSAYFVALIIFYVILGKSIGVSVLDEQNFPPWLYFIEGVVESTVITVLPILIVIKAYSSDTQEIGIRIALPKAVLWIGLISGVLIWIAISTLDLFMEQIIGPGPTHPDISKIHASNDAISYVLLITPPLLFTPISEEVYVRGFVYTIFKKKYGIPAAILFSSVFFAALHVNLWWIPHTLLVGVALALLREKYNSIMPGIVAHSTINMLSIFVGSST